MRISKKTIWVLLCIFFGFIGDIKAQTILSGWDFHQLKGKVRSYQLSLHQAYQENNQWHPKADRIYATQFIFDENGKVLKQLNFFQNDSLPNLQQIYEYDENGKYKSIAILDADNQLNARGDYVYADERKTKLKEIIFYNQVEEMQGRMTFSYHTDTWITTNIIQEKDSSLVRLYQQAVYDYQGRLLSLEVNLRNGEFHQITENQYKENDPLIQSCVVRKLPQNTSTKTVYRYAFDDQGNWIKRLEMNAKEMETPQLSIRAIEYFD